jgi:DNA-binding transcriptional ArsR family regulator
VQELAAAIQAPAHPSRRAVVEELGNGDRPVAEPTRKLRISQPTVSRHLRLLRQAGLADSQAVGARHLYRLRSDGVGAVRGHIRRVREDATTGHRLAAATQAGHSPIICPDASTP